MRPCGLAVLVQAFLSCHLNPDRLGAPECPVHLAVGGLNNSDYVARSCRESGSRISTVRAPGRSPLRDQRLHRGPAAGLQPGDRRTRTHPSPVPRPEARRDAHHRREVAGALILGHRDHQHRGGTAGVGASSARDAQRSAGTSTGDHHHHRRLAPRPPRAARSRGRSWPPPCRAPGPTPTGSTPRPRPRCSPAWHPSRPTAARSPPGTGSTATATDSSTGHSTPWCGSESSTSQPLATTSTAAPPKARPAQRPTLPNPPRRPRPLPPPRKRGRNCLTNHGSVADRRPALARLPPQTYRPGTRCREGFFADRDCAFFRSSEVSRPRAAQSKGYLTCSCPMNTFAMTASPSRRHYWDAGRALLLRAGQTPLQPHTGTVSDGNANR